MRKIIILAFWALCLTATLAIADKSIWVGAYDYDEDVGGGMFIGHTIQVLMLDGRLTALMESSGFQTDETILCDTKVGDKELTLLFRSYPDGSVTNQYDVQVYQPGEALLTLKAADDGKELLTFWQAFTLNDENAASGKVYFTKR